MESRKRFLTDPVFTKSRNNWFFTRSVYPLSCSLRPPFPCLTGALRPWPAFPPGATGAAPWGRTVVLTLPGADGCRSLEVGPSRKRWFSSCQVRSWHFSQCKRKGLSQGADGGAPKPLHAGSIVGLTAGLAEAFLSGAAEEAVGGTVPFGQLAGVIFPPQNVSSTRPLQGLAQSC